MSSPKNTIISWLTRLNVLIPPTHIALVGAGNGKGAWVQWLLHQASKSNVTLIEAESLQYAALQRTLSLMGEDARHCKIRNALVAAQKGNATFFVANLPQESGLLEPQSLLSLWPNLQMEATKELSAITLDTLLGDLGEDAESAIGKGHWLLIDCMPAGELLRASSKLELVDVVIARVLLCQSHAVSAGANLEDVAELLQQKGMRQIAVESTRHPSIGYALFVRDARAALHAQVYKHRLDCQNLGLQSEGQAKLLQECQAQVQQLSQAKVAVEKQLQEQAQQLDLLGKEHQAQVQQLTQAKAAVEKQLQEKSLQLDQQGKERHVQLEQLNLISAALLKNETQLNEVQLYLERAFGEQISKTLENQFDAGVKNQAETFSQLLQFNLSKNLDGFQEIVNASEAKVKRELNKGLANSIRQLESFMNIQSFFFCGDFLSDFHGWPISSDVGFFLLEKIKKNNYSLIIEFGSGTSTMLFAKAVEAMSEKSNELKISKSQKTEIVTFEHNRFYYEKTQEILRSRSVDKYVRLVHAPLVEWKDDSGEYLYYDSENIFKELSEKYQGEKIKILVLVDGPPGLTCKNARYPAVPLISNALARHSIDILLDDADRPEEKKVAELWDNFWLKRAVKIEKHSISAEKGILFVEVNK